MRRIGILLLTLVMLFSLAACGAKDTQTIKVEDKQDTEQTASGTAANENQPAADLQKPEDKTTTPDAAANDDKQEETKTDDTKKDGQKPDTSEKDDVKQDEQKPADNKQDTSKADTKTDTKTDNKSDTKTETPSQKPSTPSHDNGSLTTAQVKELQRWYGVSADGQWGAGSKKAAGGRTADEAWAYYQQNKKDTTPEETTKPADKPDDNSTGGTTTPPATPTTPSEPAKPTKADIDCEQAMRVGNAYAESLGFMIWDGAGGHNPPVFLERDCPESCWNQEWVEATIKRNIDFLASQLESATGEKPSDAPYGSYAANCVVRWNASAGYHEIYIYY